MARFGFGLSLCLFIACFALTQNPPANDLQALDLAAKSIAVLTDGTAISDVTLSGNATWISGADKESGVATLMANGISESRVNLELTGGVRTQIRNDTAGYPQGASVSSDGTQQPWAMHNCWINASWFFPALSPLSAASDPTVVFSYLGQETRDGATFLHLRSFRYIPDDKHPNATALIQDLSSTDFYLNAASLLPVAVMFYTHPDDDAGTNIRVEIDFSNYQAVNGIQVPFHIQKLISGGLALDIVVTGVVFNSGLPESHFAVE